MQALLKSWKGACACKGGTVSVPKGTYSVGDITFEGPCNGATHFQLEGTLIASKSHSSGQDSWIAFHNIHGFRLYGNGTFDGQGESSWGRLGYGTHVKSNGGHKTVSVSIYIWGESVPPGADFSMFLYKMIDYRIKSIDQSRIFYFQVR